MPKVQVNTELIATALFDLADELKAAILVSAAAILSRTDDDVSTNANLVIMRLDEMGRKLDGVRNSVFHTRGLTLAAKLKGQVREIDINSFVTATGLVDDRIDSYKDSFSDVIESKNREGLEFFFPSRWCFGTRRARGDRNGRGG